MAYFNPAQNFLRSVMVTYRVQLPGREPTLHAICIRVKVGKVPKAQRRDAAAKRAREQVELHRHVLLRRMHGLAAQVEVIKVDAGRA